LTLAGVSLLKDLLDGFLKLFFCHGVVFELELSPKMLGWHLEQVNKEQKF